MIYKIIKCPNCRKLLMTTSNKTFKCMFCGNSKNIKLLNIFFKSDNPTEARNYIKFQKRDDYFSKNDDIWIL